MSLRAVCLIVNSCLLHSETTCARSVVQVLSSLCCRHASVTIGKHTKQESKEGKSIQEQPAEGLALMQTAYKHLDTENYAEIK